MRPPKLTLRLCPDGGLPTVGQQFTRDDYDVYCSCGFVVLGLSSMEAALDTVAWHFGDATTPLGAPA